MKPQRAVTEAMNRMALVLELLDDPRAEAFSRSAWTIRSIENDFEELVQSGRLARVRGVDAIVVPFAQIVLTGERPADLAELEARVPKGLFEIARIKGLGAKKVKALWKLLSIESLGELEYACRENRLLDLKGFGTKTQAKVLEQLEQLRNTQVTLRRDHAWAILEPILIALEDVEAVRRAEIIGDFACGRELITKLGLLIEADEDDVDDVRAAVDRAKPAEVDVEVRLADEQTFGARQVWFTSDPSHRAALAQLAKANGWTFDEASLSVHDEVLSCPEEEDLYGALGLWPTAVERREAGVPLVRIGSAAPQLVSLEDLRGALHNHTVDSDGSATLEEMRAAATAFGLSYFGISEHSEGAFYARGLTQERLIAQVSVIAEVNESGDGCRLLSGVESDIREHGELDYDDDVLARLEIVVSSVHRRHAQNAAAMTDRMVRAASHRYTDIVGHPTGRLLLGRAPSPFDMEAFLEACRRNRTAVELNSNPARLDLSVEHLGMAKEASVLVSISADAHSVREIELLEVGVTIARRAGLSAEDVLNTRTVDELGEWVRARRQEPRAVP